MIVAMAFTNLYMFLYSLAGGILSGIGIGMIGELIYLKIGQRITKMG